MKYMNSSINAVNLLDRFITMPLYKHKDIISRPQ